MSGREIEIGLGAREKLITGAFKLAKAVSGTYGPAGRTALLDRMSGLLATKDGVTVAREINLEDPIENQGCQLLKSACVKVNDEVGDGTTSAAILTAELLREGHKRVVAGMSPVHLVKGMREARDIATSFIRDAAIPVETKDDLRQVALIASNGDEEIAENMAEGCMAVGKDGTISIEDSHGVETTLEFKEGMEIDQGMVSPIFAQGGDRLERIIEGALVAVIDAKLTGFEDIKELMEVASQFPKNELLVIAQEVEGPALSTMALNHSQGVIKCCAIRAPGFGLHKTEYLKDIAALTGASFVSSAIGMDHQKWDAEWFGSVRKATIKMKTTLFEAYEEAQETIQERMTLIKAERDRSTSEYDTDRLKERISKLAGGIAILRVGGTTEAALKERRARVEDALGSVQAALRGGVVPGGGTAYLEAGRAIVADVAETAYTNDEVQAGVSIVVDALAKPLEYLAMNAGENGGYIVRTLLDTLRAAGLKSWDGWDARERKFRNLSEDPTILDPADVVVTVIETAVSVASTLLTVEASVARPSDG